MMYEVSDTVIFVVLAGMSYLGLSYYQLKQKNKELMMMVSDLASQHFTMRLQTELEREDLIKTLQMRIETELEKENEDD